MNDNQQMDLLCRGTAEVISWVGLLKKLKAARSEGRRLRVKAGFDPTAPDIHFGHLVLLRKLRHFQDLGHEVLFLIGDFTARVGDPSGRDHTRPKLDPETIQENAQTYRDQVFKVLDPDKTSVVFNSSWLKDLDVPGLMELTSMSTVAQMLARNDFKARYESGKEITLLEFMYPLLQGYDSVALKADVELGGTDQKFNLLMGRQLQEAFHKDPQVVIMTPLIEGLDGVRKMSKSYGNYISINDSPKDMFGKIMSVSDELMLKYFEFLTDEDLKVVSKTHPKEAKIQLAINLVAQFHGTETARAEEESFRKTFSEGKVPDDVKKVSLKDFSSRNVIDIMLESGLAPSRKEAKRLVSQGAVTLNQVRIQKESDLLEEGILKVGKRRFLEIY